MFNFVKSCLSVLPLLVFIVSCETSSNPNTNNQEEELITEGDKTWQLVWSDEFDEDHLNEERWSYQYGTGQEQGLTGWGNNELQYYTDREENVYIEDGMLYIIAREENYEGMQYTSSRIRTKGKGDWLYGRIEVRAKLPEGQGIWPAIWMLPTNEDFGGWPKSGEIDIMEMVGHEPETVHGTVHFGPDWPNNQYTGTSYTLENGTFSEGFYTYSIEWEQNEIKWFVDGEEFFTVTPSDLTPHNYPFNAYFHLILNVAVGGNWPGNPDDTTKFPQQMVVDYIRIYEFK